LPILGRYRRRYLLFGLVLAASLAAVALALILWHPTRSGSQVASPVVKISYSSSYTSTIGGLQAQSGSTFLVVHLTLENMGYHNFTANPYRDMYVVVGGQTYNVSVAFFFLTHPFLTSNLNNTQSATGDVAFEVPQTTTSFTPQWRILAGEQIRLYWAAI
jgi:hypothetical protein